MTEYIMRISGSCEDSHGLERVGELVRCRECYWWAWWAKEKDGTQCNCNLLGVYTAGSWYCANGRNRND